MQVGYVPQNACLLQASLRLPGIRSPSNLMTLRALSVDHIVGTTDVAVGSIATETPCPRNIVASAHFVGDVKSHVTRPPTRIRCTLVFDTDTKSLYVEREVAHLDARVDGAIEMQTAIMDIADLRLDDDRLSAAVSRAGFSPAVGVGRTTAYERITDPSQTSRHCPRMGMTRRKSLAGGVTARFLAF